MTTRMIDKSEKINVEALKSMLLARKNTRPRFRLPITGEQCRDILLASYMAEVESRMRVFVDDNHVRDNIAHLARALTGQGSKFGVLFCGLCGNGKTTMLNAFRSAVQVLSASKCFDEKMELPVVDAKDVVRIAGNASRFEDLRIRPLLAIEDIGREPTEVLDYGNTLSPLVDLLEFRYARQLFTAVTTNLKPKQVGEKYGRRVADRCNEMFEIIVFENKSYRG